MNKKHLDIKIIGKHGAGKSAVGLAMYAWLGTMGFEVNFREQFDDEIPMSIEDNQRRLDCIKDNVIIDIEVNHYKHGKERVVPKSKIKYSSMEILWFAESKYLREQKLKRILKTYNYE